MSKHPKRIILVNGEERVGSLLLAEPCSSFGPRTFQKSSWTKPQKKDKETISTARNSKKRSAWIASSFSDFDEGNTKKTKQANINHSLVTSKAPGTFSDRPSCSSDSLINLLSRISNVQW